MTAACLGRLAATLCSAIALLGAARAAEPGPVIERVAADVVEPLMRRHGIPGFAVGVVTPEGRKILVYGVASKDGGEPVTADTLFEIGSISKTFTATLAAYAEVKGALALGDSVTKHVPELKGSALDDVSLLNLATHTSGGMPLQFPDWVTNGERLMEFYRTWTPADAPGSTRTYANPSIGLLGVAAARAMKADFARLIEGTLFPALGLRRAYLDVPRAEQATYAQGYTRSDAPIRMAPGMLDKQAYGVRTTVADLTRFVEANMGRGALDPDLARALAATHVGRYRLGAMTQALIWEQYACPVELRDLLAGDSADVAYGRSAVAEISPPAAPPTCVWINKTGSTNGFGAYVAFVPGKQLGVVLLANKNYPTAARIAAAHEILTRLDGAGRRAHGRARHEAADPSGDGGAGGDAPLSPLRRAGAPERIR